MPFFQVDDQLPVNRKIMLLTERAVDGDPMGFAALGLWTDAGAHCQASGSDGVVSRTDLMRLVLNAALADKLARLLVDAGLWHPAGHDCSRCPDVAAGSFLFHDWYQLGYDPAAKVRQTRARRKELKDPAIVEAVWARDATDPANPTVAKCRYCGHEVRRHDRRSERRPQLDHIDPLGSGPRNIVIACDVCNKRKGDRTLAQAGMTLLPPPRPEPRREPNPDQTRNQTGPGLVSAVPYAHARAGVRQGQGRGTGKGEVGQGPAGQGGVSRSKRRRKRKRGSGQRAQPQNDAGAAPEVPTPGQFGSPWHNWSGPPSPVDAESKCPEHGLDEPCRKCPRGDAQ